MNKLYITKNVIKWEVYAGMDYDILECDYKIINSLQIKSGVSGIRMGEKSDYKEFPQLERIELKLKTRE